MNLEFVDDHGAARALSEWQGQPVIIAMAYGACRSICSTTLRTLEELQARADHDGVRVVFLVVSIDPAEDTPQAWADYRKARRLDRPN
jgi:protein SCO1/2